MWMNLIVFMNYDLKIFTLMFCNFGFSLIQTIPSPYWSELVRFFCINIDIGRRHIVLLHESILIFLENLLSPQILKSWVISFAPTSEVRTAASLVVCYWWYEIRKYKGRVANVGMKFIPRFIKSVGWGSLTALMIPEAGLKIAL
jgi:hypothetical protein